MPLRLISIIAAIACGTVPVPASGQAAAVPTTEGLIADLAWILILGALVTLVFKRLKQPVVLGYILAGFLASPKFTYLPSITTLENIDFWAELGIVVLMFTLGLEFSFKKLVNSGVSAILTAFVIITGMTFVGFGVGRLLNFAFTSSIFLGGMLSMSSTTIILKAFTDLGLRQKKFASLVLSVLIIEDLFAVLMLVLLSSLAVGDVHGSELAFSIFKLVFYLILWYVVGVWLIPTFFKATRKLMNQETLLVVSMGICFGMAVLSVVCGFSLELGAFIGGSIIAGTIMAEKIEHVVAPVKDLFGAVFFISVGMMVDPAIIAGYWDIILVLAGVVIIGMMIFGTAGMLLTGQSLRVAMESGFSLTQIGEFSFIIASLGMSLHVLNPALYPIIVAVSVITIFTTPYFIKMAGPAYRLVERHLPRRLRFLIDRISTNQTDSSDSRRIWKAVIVRYLWRVVLYSVMLIAILTLSKSYLFPFMEGLSGSWGHFLATVITLAAMSPFLVALSLSASRPQERERLNVASGFYNVPLFAMKVIRYLLALYFVLYLVSMAYPMRVTLLVLVGIVLLVVIVVLGRINGKARDMEKRFMSNLNERENVRSGRDNNLVGDLHLAYIRVGDNSPFAGDRIVDSGLRRDYGISISSIQRGMHTFTLPDKDARIFPGDTLGVIGTDEEIHKFNSDMESYEKAAEDLNISQPSTELLNIYLSPESPLVGKDLAQARLREDYFAMLLKVTRLDAKGEPQDIDPAPGLVFRSGDRLWLVGDPNLINKLK